MATDYAITGQVKDPQGKPLEDLLVEAFDSDFGSADDYLGHTFTDSNGSFEIKFKEESFKGPYNILEMGPDVYLVITDRYGVIKKTETRINASNKDLKFGDIVITDDRPFDDPYANAAPRMIALFSSAGESIDLTQVQPFRTNAQLLRLITTYIHYTDPRINKLYGIPGPQVIARPKEFPSHDHSIPWRRTG